MRTFKIITVTEFKENYYLLYAVNKGYVDKAKETVEKFKNESASFDTKKEFKLDISIQIGIDTNDKGVVTYVFFNDCRVVFVNHSFIEVEFGGWSGDNKWDFSLLSSAFKKDNIQHTYWDNALDRANQPNKVGKLTYNKVKAWIDHLTEASKKINRQIFANITELEYIREKLADHPIRWTNENTGYYERNGLEYKVEITNFGYTETVTLRSKSHSIDAFLQLSDNKYIS